MAIGGGLQSSLPAHGVPEAEINEATTSANEEISQLPNEAAEIVIVNEDGDRLTWDEAARHRRESSQDALELPNNLTLGREKSASSSQTTLTPEGSDNKSASSRSQAAPASSSGSVHDVERQLETVGNVLQDGQEARLDFSKLGQSFSRLIRVFHGSLLTLFRADLVTRQAFLLKCTKALLTFGAPSHRLEADMEFAADVLDVPAQFVHTPNAVVVNFGMAGSHLSESVFVKHANGGLDLGNVRTLHQLLLHAVGRLILSHSQMHASFTLSMLSGVSLRTEL